MNHHFLLNLWDQWLRAILLRLDLLDPYFLLLLLDLWGRVLLLRLGPLDQ